MNWSTHQILAGIALICALFGGGIGWIGESPNYRGGLSGLALALVLVCVALLVS
jgi:hypothetical protein